MKAAMAGGRRRPRGGRRARRWAVGQDAAERALPSSARTRRARAKGNRKEVAEIETRNVGKALAPEGGAGAGGRELPLLRIGGSPRLREAPARSGATPLLHAQGAGGRLRADRPVELPLMLATWKLAPALAAGCTVVPSRTPPRRSARSPRAARGRGRNPGRRRQRRPRRRADDGYEARLASRRGQGRVHGVDGDRPRDHAPASDPLKRVSLELGGKSPTSSSPMPTSTMRSLEFGLVDLLLGRAAAKRCACSSRSRCTTSSSPASPRAAKPEVGILSTQTQVGSSISGAHRDKVHGLVDGRDEGAEVVTGGEAPDGNGFFYPPTVLANVENRMVVAQEDLRSRRHRHPVRGREGRGDRERRQVRGQRPRPCGLATRREATARPSRSG